MAGKAFTLLVAVIGTLQAIAASPIVSADAADQLSLTFRNSVAQAIRDNLERQQLNSYANTQSIQFVGPRSNGNNHHAAPELPALPSLHTALPAAATVVNVPTAAIVATVAPVHYTPELPTQDNEIDPNIPADVAAVLANEEEQAKNAHYSFDSSVKDTINGHSHTRQETRDGLSLSGSYSYNDGFFQRTVHYEADENGYRVTK